MIDKRTFFETQEWIVRRIHNYRKFNVFDVGTSVGNTVAWYDEHLPGSNIYGYEPLPDIAERARDRFAGRRNIHIIPSALGSYTGVAEFFRGGNIGQFSSTRPLFRWGKQYTRYTLAPTDDVPMTTLDAEMERLKIARVHILKLDVHGAEIDIFRGGQEALRKQAIDVIGVEIYFVPLFEDSPLFFDLSRYLSGIGYTLYNMYGLTSHDDVGQLMWADAIFISHKVREALEGGYTW